MHFQIPKPKVFLNLFQDRDESEGVQDDIYMSDPKVNQGDLEVALSNTSRLVALIQTNPKISKAELNPLLQYDDAILLFLQLGLLYTILKWLLLLLFS